MSQSTLNFKVGVFVLSAIALGIGLVVYVGADELRRDSLPAETYLAESVQGLEVGSPVKYRGKDIGQVSGISVVRSKYPEVRAAAGLEHLGRWMAVRMELFDPLVGGEGGVLQPEALQREIEAGLRIRLASQGITGIAYMEVDYEEPGEFPPLRLAWTPAGGATYVPSAPSTTSRFLESADALFTNLQDADMSGVLVELRSFLVDVRHGLDQLNVDDLSNESSEFLIAGTQFLEELTRAAASLRGRVEAEEIDAILTELAASSGALRGLAERAEADLPAVSKELTGALAEVRAAAVALRELASSEEVTAATEALPTLIARADEALLRLDLALAGAGESTSATVENLRVFAKNLRELSELAKAYPSVLLLGEPPPGSATDRP